MNSNEKSIHVFNEYWEYQRTIFPPSNEYLYNGPVASIYVNGSIYVSSGSLLNKYDKYLNLTKQVRIINANVVGLYYNLANQMIYTVARLKYGINVYDKDLNFNRTISTDYRPWFITEYNGQMVVTEFGIGNIYFHHNETSYR